MRDKRDFKVTSVKFCQHRGIYTVTFTGFGKEVEMKEKFNNFREMRKVLSEKYAINIPLKKNMNFSGYDYLSAYYRPDQKRKAEFKLERPATIKIKAGDANE